MDRVKAIYNNPPVKLPAYTGPSRPKTSPAIMNKEIRALYNTNNANSTTNTVEEEDDFRFVIENNLHVSGNGGINKETTGDQDSVRSNTNKWMESEQVRPPRGLIVEEGSSVDDDSAGGQLQEWKVRADMNAVPLYGILLEGMYD